MGVCMHIEGVTCANCEPRKQWVPGVLRYVPANPAAVPVAAPGDAPMGWLCPRCGGSNNPAMPSCFNCPPPSTAAGSI